MTYVNWNSKTAVSRLYGRQDVTKIVTFCALTQTALIGEEAGQ